MNGYGNGQFNGQYNGQNNQFNQNSQFSQSTQNNGQNNQYGYGNYEYANNQYGLRDKVDGGSGLIQTNPSEPQFTSLENTIIVDTRDCIGKRSLQDAITYFEAIGGRGTAHGTVLDATNTNPIVITFNSVTQLKNGDSVIFQGIRGNTNANGIHTISSINTILNTAIITAGGNGAYLGGGTWTRPEDAGYPRISENSSTIMGNTMIINLEKELKLIRTLSLFHIVIPRDIIPLQVYLNDFITVSTNTFPEFYATTSSQWETFIPQEASNMEPRLIGFYSTPLELWRSYDYGGSFSMQNQVTPPPLQLWNPPIGAWPNQPVPYPYQTVPTYRSNDFPVVGKAGLYHLILSGYGIYDLVDWTAYTGPGNEAADRAVTSIVRKLLLLLICRNQSYHNVSYIDMILNCNIVTAGSTYVDAWGFGDFQRYIPGPGVGQTYQPGTNSAYAVAHIFSGNPTQVAADHPIAFPDFRGNVWGPYDAPGDRFQRLGLRDTIQDLFLNGDLNNLLGEPIIIPTIPVGGFIYDRVPQTFGLNFNSAINANLDNVQFSTNPNILNAMRIKANGFGAASIRANGFGNPLYTNVYNSISGFGAGGIGPSNMGTPSAWVNHGIYGAGSSFSDPIAQGPSGPNLTPATASATDVGTGALPGYRASFYDLGTNNGQFITEIRNYVNFTVNEIPDTDLIIRIEEALRDDRAQSTRSFNSDALIDVPIRLNVGSTSGTIQYIEALQALVAQSTGYWEKRYLTPTASLSKLHISFYTYQGTPIPLETMLQQREISDFLQTFVYISEFLELADPFLYFSPLFDPTNPQLIGRTRRYFQIIFKAQTYNGLPPGINPDSANRKMLAGGPNQNFVPFS